MIDRAPLAEQIAGRVWRSSQFHEDLRCLHFAGVYRSLTGSLPRQVPGEESLLRLLQAGCILAGSSDVIYRQAAYRIAVAALTLFAEGYDNLKNIADVILSRLGNFPAVAHLYRTTSCQRNYALPTPVLYELLQHEAANTVRVADTDLILTDFQRRLWDMLRRHDALSVTAPTSAGKSFALQQYLASVFLADSIHYVLYLVPTRALLHQVSDAINRVLGAHLHEEVLVSTIPAPPSELKMARGVYVLTQERTHVLFEAAPQLAFDMAVVDEAQTIGDGARGILLQVVIEKLLERNPQTRVFFGAPFSANPEHFAYLFPRHLQPVREEESPVAQNLVSAEIKDGATAHIDLAVWVEGQWQDVVSVPCEVELSDDSAALAYVSYAIGKPGKSIVFAGSPAACENVADKIRQWIVDSGPTAEPHADMVEFAALIRDHIHPDYYLADMAERGVAFHYGRMPTILRRAIEYYFTESPNLQFLVCTSTLLHGVNLPAKNLFMLKPSEGEKWLSKKAEPMRSTSFWNLAGRAGRLGKDFEGNVFLVKKAQWESDPLSGEKQQTISSSLYDVVNTRAQELLALSRTTQVTTDVEGTLESAFVKLYTDFKRGRLDRTLLKSPLPVDTTWAAQIRESFQALQFTVPDDALENNIAISPFRQQRMLDYIRLSIANGEVEKLIPLHPEARDAYENYVRLFNRYETKFEGRDRATKTPRYIAVVALQWMKGMPYPQMIKECMKFRKSSLPTVIRGMMDTIEDTLRFRTVQYTRCYIDLLCAALDERGLSDMKGRIPSIPLYLEIGACSGTMVNLVGLGFSRTTAGLLNQLAANHSMDRSQCVVWLLRERWEASNLPRVCKNEIESVLAR